MNLVINNHDLSLVVHEFEVVSGDKTIGSAIEVDIKSEAYIFGKKRMRKLKLERMKEETIDMINYKLNTKGF